MPIGHNREYMWFSTLEQKNRGGLEKPPSSTTYVCQLTEKAIQLQENVHARALPKKNAAELSEVSTMNKLYPELHDHMFESAVESNHLVRLVKWVVGCYVKIRMHHAVRQATAKITEPKIRKQLTKLVVANHQ
ncbi:hypothetical protein MRX96_004142 [Rhipicephalus microplus]